jgi:serine/threonine protein phosphatase PrpC
MKLGIVPEADRLPDSPDSVLHVEPTIGAQLRTKGHLYLLVTSRVAGARALEATRLVADTIRSEYYYDESAGIRICLAKAIRAANKRLTHARERTALERGAAAAAAASAAANAGIAGGPIGIAVAVIRDNELYVCTVGPAEAYLSRGARLSTLPDPHRDRGLPAADLEPDVWRGEINVGDQLLLVSPTVVELLGADELKDALVTLHPQSAVEHLHRRYREAGGRGSDGAITLEVAEVAVSRSGRAPVPVRPAEPLAGMPDRSPIPLVDSVAGGMAAAQAASRRAQDAAGGVASRLLLRLQDMLPARAAPNRRVTPMTARREMQKRAAVAILSFLVVIAVLGTGVFVLGGRVPAGQVISSLEAGQQALEQARADLKRVQGPGVDLVTNDPRTAEKLLKDAITKLDIAASAGIPSATLSSLRNQTVTSLDRLYRMSDVSESVLLQFPANQPIDLKAIIKGPDGAPYVVDAGTKTVYRIDLAAKKATAIFRSGTKAAGKTEGDPRFLAVGGRDLFMVDSKSVVWRWRAANTTGKGTVSRVVVNGSSEWGDDILAIGTFVRNADAGLYNLYVVDPSQQQILAYAPAFDGGGYPAAPSGRLTTPRDVSGITSLYIDGDIWAADRGQLLRFVGGKSEGWVAADPGDGILRPAPRFKLVTSGSARREGKVYGLDPASRRVIAYTKADGAFVAQYRLGGTSTAWDDMRAWYVEPGAADQPDTLVWITANAIHQTVLEAVTAAASASPSGSGGPPASHAASGAPASATP